MAISFKGAKKLRRRNGFTNKAVIKVPLPSPEYSYPLQSGDLLLTPLVQESAHVTAGQKIADLESFAALPVHSSVSGRVVHVSDKFICVENDLLNEKNAPSKTDKSYSSLTTLELLWIIREAGIYDTVSGVPAHVLLSPKKTPDTIVVCCFDSDPYVSSLQIAASKYPETIINGLNIALRISGAKKAIIAVENDTKKTFSKFKELLRFNSSISLIALKARYPQSDRDILVKTVTGHPAGDESIAISCETLCNIARTVNTGYPIIRKLVTVSGDDILPPNNFSVPLGLAVSSLLTDAGYEGAKTVIENGVVTGAVIKSPNAPVTRSTNALSAFMSRENIPKYREEPI